jgi:Flp pilus assembly protein TadG
VLGRWLQSAAARQRGAAAVDFALVASVLMTLLLGMVDLARVFMADQDVAMAAREGARYALSANRFGDCDGIRTAATNLAARSKLTAARVTIQYDHGAGTSPFATCPAQAAALVSGDRIVVTATNTVDPIFPGFTSITVSATDRRTITKQASS